MTDTQLHPAAWRPNKRGVQIEINAGVQPPERWKAQLDLLRSAGASFNERAKRWHMILTEDQLTTAVLDKKRTLQPGQRPRHGRRRGRATRWIRRRG